MAVTDDLFWSRVQKTDSCWLWSAGVNKDGYGCVHRRPKRWLAHVYAYTLTRGLVPEGLTLDHLCRVRNCVNPDHLEPVTLRENILRGENQAAINVRATRCVNGHEFTAANTRTSRRGWRICIACKRKRDAESARRRRAHV